MKHIITAILLLLCFAAIAQRIPVREETSLRWGYSPVTGDSAFFEMRTITYSDSTRSSDEQLRGDTAQVINIIAVDAINKAKKFAGAANEVWSKEVVIDYILQADTLLRTLGGSITGFSIGLYGQQVDSTSWDIISTEMGNFTGFLTIGPNGNTLRMLIGATNYTLLPVGDAWIRFQNFPAGSFTDLHRKAGPGLEFRSLDQSFIIRRQ